MTMEIAAQKRLAAARALEFVQPGMRLGLGTGSTAQHFVELLAERVRSGLKILAVPTSETTRANAERLSVPLSTLDEVAELDLAVDGADEIAPDLDVIKGSGGALLREKIVAASAACMIVIADQTKWVSNLGHFPLPIEVTPFGLAATRRAVKAVTVRGGNADSVVLRLGKDGHPFVTDGGNWILDAAFGRIANPQSIADQLAAIPGVVEHGLFIGLVHRVILAGPEGVNVIERPS